MGWATDLWPSKTNICRVNGLIKYNDILKHCGLLIYSLSLACLSNAQPISTKCQWIEAIIISTCRGLCASAEQAFSLANTQMNSWLLVSTWFVGRTKRDYLVSDAFAELSWLWILGSSSSMLSGSCSHSDKCAHGDMGSKRLKVEVPKPSEALGLKVACSYHCGFLLVSTCHRSIFEVKRNRIYFLVGFLMCSKRRKIKIHISNQSPRIWLKGSNQ
jgi:hypothetical protein